MAAVWVPALSRADGGNGADPGAAGEVIPLPLGQAERERLLAQAPGCYERRDAGCYVGIAGGYASGTHTAYHAAFSLLRKSPSPDRQVLTGRCGAGSGSYFMHLQCFADTLDLVASEDAGGLQRLHGLVIPRSPLRRARGGWCLLARQGLVERAARAPGLDAIDGGAVVPAGALPPPEPPPAGSPGVAGSTATSGGWSFSPFRRDAGCDPSGVGYGSGTSVLDQFTPSALRFPPGFFLPPGTLDPSRRPAETMPPRPPTSAPRIPGATPRDPTGMASML